MLLIKIMAYIMIVLGAIFTAIAILVIVKVDEWVDIVTGLLFLGPVSLTVGILVLRKLKTDVNLEVLKKNSKK